MAKTRNGSANGTKRPAEEKPLAAYVTSLTVENVRCFGPKQTLDLSDGRGGPARWTIILGENGTGKTTLLQILTGFEQLLPSPYFRGSIPPWEQPGVEPRDHIQCELYFVRGSGLEAIEPKSTRRAFYERARVVNDWEVSPFPTYYAYGAGRRLARGALVEGREDDPVGTLFDEHARLRNAEGWLLQLELASLRPSDGRARHQARLEQIKELLTGGLLIDVDDIQFVSAPGPRPVAHVEFRTPYGWVPLRRLGYGYQTLIAWVVDFASRMVERYPDSKNPLHEPAIVVVDEIDLHLHPAWQRKLTTFLSERFPNTQFIATAHSPLTVQAAEGANLAVLKRVGDHVEIVNDVDDIRNWRLDQIVTSDLFGLPSASPPRVERLFEEKRELLAKAKPSKADRQRLKTLQDEIDTFPVGDSAATVKEMDILRRALGLLKDPSPHDPRPQAADPANGTHDGRGDGRR